MQLHIFKLKKIDFFLFSMLRLIGTGLSYLDLTLRAITRIQEADEVYMDVYTNRIKDLDLIEKTVNRKIKKLGRKQVESDFLLQKALKNDVVLLVSGDPLSATTHVTFLLEAKKMGIKTEVIHAVSIFTAVAECGLSLYKFGRTTTLAYPEVDYRPTSPIDVIKQNQKSGLHTLLLLYIEADEKRFMTTKEGADILKQHGIKDKIIACCNAGTNERKFVYGSIEKIAKSGLEDTPACIIIPGEISEYEREAIEKLCTTNETR